MEDKYYFNLDNKEYIFDRDNGDVDKYIVFACAKNEDNYIVEWVEHYLNLGFDKILLADNNDNPETLNVILRKYILEGKVQIFPCKDITYLQLPLYTQYCRYGNYKWCAYFDCDEFLELPSHKSIKDFLNTIDDDVDCVCFNWLVFGTNGEIYHKEGSVQDRFKEPLRPILYQKENGFLKSIIRGDHKDKEDSYFFSAHIIRNNKRDLKYSVGGYHIENKIAENIYPFYYKNGYIKHYYTKSLEEWYKKSSRGWADGTQSLNTLACSYFFRNYNFEINNFAIGPFLRDLEYDASSNELFNEFDVFKMCLSPEKNYYSFISYILIKMSIVKDKTFVFADKDLDEALYNIMLEYSIVTGNKVVYIFNDERMWDMYLRYNKNAAKTYYVITCL